MIKSKQRMLITGVSGLLGSNLGHYFKDKYDVLGLYHSHPVKLDGIYTDQCDVTNHENVHSLLSRFKPSIVIHCASLTNIDICEKDRAGTDAINVMSTRFFVSSLPPLSLLIYLSSDAVYDGIAGSTAEDDHISPRNYYGRSKYAGESEALKRKNALVLRTNIFGWNIQSKNSLGEWILHELQAGKSIDCFQDVFFSTIYTIELARVIDIAIQKKISGVYNCGSSDSCSKFEFAVRIADIFGLDKSLIRPISIDNHNFLAPRGKNLTLNVQKLQKALDYNLPTIDRSIDAFYRDYKCGWSADLKNKNAPLQTADVIPYGRQSIDENDIQSVVNIIRSDRLTQGPTVDEFEMCLAKYCGVDYGVAMNSATSVLHAACIAAGVGADHEVITSPITFVASANCALYCGAKPVFADIDPKTYNISPEEIEKKMTRRTKVVIPVHFAGQCCDMDSICRVVRRAEEKYGHKIYIIEDACHALGSLYKNTKVGSCTYADMTVLSFHPIKHITTGEGGMALLNDELLYKKLKKVRSHGITSTPDEFMNFEQAFHRSKAGIERRANPWYYEQIALGYNYRLTDIQSALGLSQMSRLDLFRTRRREIVNTYNASFKGCEYLTIPFEDPKCDSNFHLYVLLFDFHKMNMDRAELMWSLKSKGIQTQVHYIPVHLQPYYVNNVGTKKGDCPNAERYYSGCLSIPLFPAMTDNEVKKVIRSIKSIS